MKRKYFLEGFDNLILEIKNPIKRKEIKVNDFFENELHKSTLVYKISIQDIKEGEPLQKAYHPLHPIVNKDVYQNIINDKDYKKVASYLKGQKVLNIFDFQIFKDKEEKNYYLFTENSQLNLSKEEAFYIYCYKFSKRENEELKQYIKQKVFNANSKNEMEHFVQKSQYALENVTSKLLVDINPDNTLELYEINQENTVKECLKITYIHIEKLLRFIEKEYQNFLNENIKVPLRTVLINEVKIAPKLQLVKETLLNLNIDQELLKSAYQPILKLSTISIQEKMTYQQFNYCSEYINELDRLFSNATTNEISEKLYCWLIELNYNEVNYFQWLTIMIKTEVNNKKTEKEKIDKLYKLLKETNQKQATIHNKYNNKIPDLKYQITTWLEEEIQYRSKKINTSSFEITSSKNANSEKLHIGLSVAQLGWFINLLIKVKIIKNTNQKEVIRFFATNCKTDNQENISTDSLTVKYYNAEQSSKNFLKEKFIEILNLSKN